MLERGTKVVQDCITSPNVCLEGDRGHHAALVCQMNGNQRTNEERSEDAATVVVALNAYLNPESLSDDELEARIAELEAVRYDRRAAE